MSDHVLDGMDREILRILQDNAKASAREIGRRVGSPITTIYSRINRMEENGVIKGYNTLLDDRALGRPTTAFILASFTYRTPGREEPLDQKEVALEVAEFPEVQEVHIISGDWDYIIKVKERDVEAVGDFVVDKLRTVRGIDNTLTCMVFNSVKESIGVPV